MRVLANKQQQEQKNYENDLRNIKMKFTKA